MATFYGGMRELADHKRPWVRLTVDQQGLRLGGRLPWSRLPTYVIAWSQVERIEPVDARFRSSLGVRFVLRAPVPALQGAPNAARWPDAQAPIFLCSGMARYSHFRRLMAALPPALIAQPAPAA